MHILLISDAYPPEIRSIAGMVREVALSLTAKGHAVTVVTAWPQYNLPNGVTPHDYRAVTIESGVTVLRIKTPPLHNSPYIIRGIAQLLTPFLFLRVLRKHQINTVDTISIYVPPLPLGRLGSLLKRRYGAHIVVNIQDVFPQNAIDLGFMTNSLLISFFERMEKRTYEVADHITTCTENARQFLIEKKNIAPTRISTLHNWIDVAPYRAAQNSGIFRKRYGIDNDCCVVLFAGIHGPSQGLDAVLDLVQFMLRERVHFLFVGDGTEKKRLQERARREGLHNVQFEPFVDPKDYPSLLCEVDIGLMALDADCKTPTIPGKFFGYAAAGLPIIALLNSESEGHRIMKEAQCGYVALPHETTRLTTALRALIASEAERRAMGAQGRRYITTHCAKEHCMNTIEHLLTPKSTWEAP